jgi:hypothetical protein
LGGIASDTGILSGGAISESLIEGSEQRVNSGSEQLAVYKQKKQ